jgi:hypothetical protein
MSIDSVNSNTAAYQPPPPNGVNGQQGGQIGQDFKALAKALSSGSLSDAQTAFASIQTDMQNGPGGSASSSTSSTGSSGSSSSTNPLQALAAALKSGNLQDAQQAFAALQQGGKGHHHHHKGSGASSSDPTSSTNGSSTSSSSGIQSDFQALATALGSNNLSNAQTAFSTLQSDFKSSFGGTPQSSPDPTGTTGNNVDIYT